MNTFQILIIVLGVIFVVSELYFNISNKVTSIIRYKEQKEAIEKTNNYEDQIKVLTVRLGEILTDNQTIRNDLRNWQNTAATYKNALDDKTEELNDWKNNNINYKEKLEEANNSKFRLQVEYDRLLKDYNELKKD